MKLQFWAINNDQVSGARPLEEEIKKFQKATRIQVELREFPWGKIWSSLINSIKENNRPDVVQIGNSWVSILKEIGFLEDITELLNSKEYKNNLYNISPKIDKRYYAMPWILDICLFFVRKNIEYNKFKFNSIHDVEVFCDKINKKNIFAIGGKKENILIQYLSSFIWALNGRYIHHNRINLLEDSNFQGIVSFFNLIKKYGIKKTLSNIYGNIMWEFFLQEKGLFAFANAWAINAFIKPHNKIDDFSVHVIPGNKAQRFPFKGGSCLGVVKGTKKYKESIKLIQYLSSFQSQKEYFSRIGLLPSRKDVMKQVIDNFIYKDAILSTLNSGRIYPPVPYWSSFENIFTDFINLMFHCIENNRYNENRLKKELNLVNTRINSVIELWEQ